MSNQTNIVSISSNQKMPPLRTLLFAHKSKAADMHKVWHNGDMAPDSFDIQFDPKDTDYWLVLWENKLDNALYYTTPDPSFFEKLIKGIEKDIDKALVDALNAEMTGLGTAAKTACEIIFDHLKPGDTNGWVKHNLDENSATNSANQWMTCFYWAADRTHTQFNNGGHVTKTNIAIHVPS